jgi:hypothetical protein
MTLLLRAIFKYSGKTNAARASEAGLTLRQSKPVVISHRLFLNKSKDLDHVPLSKLPDA